MKKPGLFKGSLAAKLHKESAEAREKGLMRAHLWLNKRWERLVERLTDAAGRGENHYVITAHMCMAWLDDKFDIPDFWKEALVQRLQENGFRARVLSEDSVSVNWA